MANMELITSVTVGAGGAASVTLPATGTIPQTYTDLKILVSARTTDTNSKVMDISFNGNTSSFTNRYLLASDNSALSGANFNRFSNLQNSSSNTSNTFSNGEIYIPNYAGSNYKSYSGDGVQETNASLGATLVLVAGLWSNTAAITSITLSPVVGSWVEGSTFYLYGISNVTSTTKATGGIVSSDGVYNYHMFPFSGTFTPTTAISADVLCIAGGGGGGTRHAGGGGAGGVSYQTSRSLTATGYSITVGAGGIGGIGAPPVGPTYPAAGTNGSNSTFDTITSLGGGGGGGGGFAPLSGGSGGGGNGSTPLTTGGAATQGNSGGATGYGNAGGNGTASGNIGGGGGGAGAVGSVGAGNGGAGGAGLNTFSAFASATQTGANNGYYAGGGGGAIYAASGTSSGGAGGGGGGVATGTGGAGTTNTGSGGGGGGYDYSFTVNGGNGGSGIVIIRYAI